MKKTELILLAFFYLSMLLAFLHIPFSGVFFVITSSLFSILYFGLGLPFLMGLNEKTIFQKNAFGDQTTIQIIPASLATLSLSTSIIAIMFKVQMWPMSKPMFVLSFATIIISLIVATVFSKGKPAIISRNIFIRFVFITIPAFIIFLTPELTIASIHYRDEPRIYEAYKNVLEHPGDTTYVNQLHRARGTVIPPERNSN